MHEPDEDEPDAIRARQDPAGSLRRLIGGYRATQVIHAAAVLGVADHMSVDPRPSDEVAAAVGAHAPTVYRLLRALAALGVLHEDGERRFSLTAMGECLRDDADPSLRPWATFTGEAHRWQAWGHFAHAVKTGENAFAALHGIDAWSWRQGHPAQGEIFDAAMTAHSRLGDRAIAAAFDFGRFARIADVGGGQGALLGAVLAAHPNASGVLFDQPHVVATAGPVLAAAGIADRCEVVGGSFFETVPHGCAAYLLKCVLHDWGDGAAVRILEACRRAMSADARLIVIERLLGPPDQDAEGKLSDLDMLVVPGGQERTRAEFEALFAAAGFRLTHVGASGAGPSLMVAERA